MKTLLKEIQLDYVTKAMSDVSDATKAHCKERIEQIENILIGLDKPQHLVSFNMTVKMDQYFVDQFPARAADEMRYTAARDIAKAIVDNELFTITKTLIPADRVTIYTAKLDFISNHKTPESRTCYLLREA